MKIKEIIDLPIKEAISPLDVRRSIRKNIGNNKKKGQTKKSVKQLQSR
jgi:hypothetical protein